MIRRTERGKRKRAAGFALEALEDRVVLSASAAGSGVVAHYRAAVDQLDGRLQAKVNQLSALIVRRTAQIDSKAETAVSDSAAKLDGGRAADARTSLARSSAAIAREDDAFVKNVDRKVNVFTADFSRKLGEVTAMYGRLDPAIRAANPAVKANFRDALTSIGPTLEGEARTASDALRGTMASVRAGVDQAGTAGASAMSRAEAADQALAGASQAQQAADRSAVDAFWSRYYGGFNALAAELAALPSPSPGSMSGHALAVSKGGAVPTIEHAPGTVHRLTSVGPASGAYLAGSTATSGGSTAASTTNGNGGTTGTGTSVIGTGGTPGTGSVSGTVTGTTGATTTGALASGTAGTSAAGPTGTGTTTGLGSTGALGSGAFVGPVSSTGTGTGTFTGPVATTGTGTGTATGGGTTTGTLTTGTTTGAGTTIGSIGTVSTGSGTFVGPISSTGLGTGTGLGGSTGTAGASATSGSTIGGTGASPSDGIA